VGEGPPALRRVILVAQEVVMNHARRRVTDAEEAQTLLDAWQDSGMAFRAFCAAHRVDGRSLRSWCPKEAAQSVRLVELMPMTAPAPTKATYRLTVGDVVLELDDHFQEETLARLLSVLRC
jgi:hypothetical protein